MVLNLNYLEDQIKKLNLSLSKQVAIAVSGGADSMCLTFLLAAFCKKNNIKLVALTVNHNIREDSLAEAQWVHSFLEERGINHIILDNKTPIGHTSIEEDARQIRYQLLTDYCNKKNINHLFIAHQQEDQAETFLSRLARGSGIDGLSAIKNVSKRNGIFLVRPFLNISKKDMVNWLKKNSITWVNDPMNNNPVYERVKWRQFLPKLEENGISTKGISLSTHRLNRALQALQWITDDALLKCVSYFNEGYALIEKEKFIKYPEEIRIRILTEVLKNIGQTDKIISLELLERAIFSFPQKMTLANCVIVPHKRGIFIAKEYSKLEKRKKIKAHTKTKWDRFEITIPFNGYVQAKAPLKHKKNIPYLVQQSFPFFEMEKELENNQDIEYKNKTNNKIDIKFIYNH